VMQEQNTIDTDTAESVTSNVYHLEILRVVLQKNVFMTVKYFIKYLVFFKYFERAKFLCFLEEATTSKCIMYRLAKMINNRPWTNYNSPWSLVLVTDW